MAKRRPGTTVTAVEPGGRRRVDIKFFDDGSIRFAPKEAGPMVLAQAYLSGRGYDLRVELRPAPGSPWAPDSVKE